MKKLDTLCDATAKKIVQHTLQSAMEGGPECPHTWFYQPRRRRKSLRRTGLRPLTSNLNPKLWSVSPPNAQTNRGRRQRSNKAAGAFELSISRFLCHSTCFGKIYC